MACNYWKICDNFYVFCIFLFILSSVCANSEYYNYATEGVLAGREDEFSYSFHSINKRQTNAGSDVSVVKNATETATKPTNLTLLPKNANKDKNSTSTAPKKVPENVQLPSTKKGPDANSTTNTTIFLNKTLPDEILDDLSISNFTESDSDLNKTLSENNVTKTQTDTHLYYNSTYIIDKEAGERYWVNMSAEEDVIVNDLLSKSHRRAATVKLSFDFPFYGHLVRNVTIATGGFLYTGEYVHSWLAATQYVAPLMANFDTSLSNSSFIKYLDNGTAFTVQWEKVSLQDKPKEGEFTFQATLHKNGDIIFVYKHVPLSISSIQDSHHPVKIGLSDAYIINRTIFFIHRKTIYEYHRVQFKKEEIRNWTVIYLKALPTCLDNKDCESCFNNLSKFECSWCPSTNRCSNLGLDRHRQDWLTKGCDRNHVFDCSKMSSVTLLPHIEESEVHRSVDNSISEDVADVSRASRVAQEEGPGSAEGGPTQSSSKASFSGVMAIFLLLALVASIAIWILYAYKNPHSTSGQILIKYRPTQWRWRRGEARYTAATIHM